MAGGAHGGYSGGGFGHASAGGKGFAGGAGKGGFHGGFHDGHGHRNGFAFGYGYPGYGYPGYGYAAIWPGYYDYWNGGISYDWDYVNFPPNDGGQNYPPEQQAAPSANASQPVVMMASREASPAPQSPKLVEIPLPKDAVVQAKPPALFVLNSGEQLESRRYVLSVDSLRIEVGRKQRVIPISALNLEATLAANQERGINLAFPQDRSSLFLGF
ncbi:MAG TPA: hypothetical protein VKB58_01765 [Terriglobales bacterium]|nr:hypothetical protein [Terriglobales bacterium]